VNVQALSPGELRVAAQQRLMPLTGIVDRHWSITARIIQRVDDEKLYVGYGFVSCTQWAEDELGVDSYDVVRLLQLANLMNQAPQVLPEHWRKLPQSKAREILRVVNLGGSPWEWVTKGLAAKTTDELRISIAKALDPADTLKEVWVRESVRMPAASLALRDAARILALPEATGKPDEPKERIHHPDVKWRCDDVIVAHFVTSVAKQEGMLPATGIEDTEIPPELVETVLQMSEESAAE